ncbi:type IV pilus secretin PilQ, partial [Candidatus Halobeggiatoa sp. HSG11]|nr:type IV pilus secretin PilQ [Candidatus Halobeggiatoa sp. HSG11]
YLYSIVILIGINFISTVVAFDGINQLEKIDFSTMPGNRVQIQLMFANNNITHRSFSTDNPARIVLDFPNTTLKLAKKSHIIGIGVVQNTNAVETQDRTRIVLSLVRMVPFDIIVENKRLLISIENVAFKNISKSNDSLSSASTLSSTNTASLSNTRNGYVLSGNHIQNINFHRTKDGAGQVAINLSDPAIIVNVDMEREINNIAVKIPNTKLPGNLDRRLDVMDFATPITFVDTLSKGNNIRINIGVRGNYEYHAYQTENIYMVEVKEKVEIKQKQLKIEERKYEGQLVSFNFQDINVRAALSLLFDLPGVGLNMVAGEEVKGHVTLRLKNIPWDQALDIILEARGLGMRKIGNVVMIDLRQNIDERKQKELAAQQKIKELEPLYTEFIIINYAKAADIVSLLRTGGQHSFISNRGSVSMDERTNTVIIQDTAAKIKEIRNLISSLDTPVRQVLIESRIVIANSSFGKELGVKFGYSGNEDLGHGNGIVLGGKLGGNTKFSNGTGFTTENSQPYGEGDGENFLVSLPIAAPTAAVGLAVGKIGSYLLQLELAAMQSEGNGEVISSPRVVTGNQQEAVITQGTELPYFPPAGVGAAAKVQWKQAVLELKVIPQITPDDRVSMTLAIKKDAPGDEIGGEISIDKREVKTNVLVDNGETVVLGGVYERSDRNAMRRVPFFSDLPLIGALFRHKSRTSSKSELLIFVTPKILKEAT